MKAIEADALSKTYGEHKVVDGVDIRVGAGEILGFVGPNGAGKTTTWSLLTGLLRPTAGSVHLLGRPVDPNDLELKRQLGIVPDQSSLFDALTGEELLLAFGRLYGLTVPDLGRRVDEVLSVFDLEDAATKPVATYSHGMRKKIRLSASILHSPRILFLDEPFEGMDAPSARVAMRILEQLAQTGSAIFLTSHLLDYVERLSTHLVVIKDGRILLACRREDLQQAFEPGSDSETDGAGRLERLILKISGDGGSRRALSWLRPETSP